MKSIKQYWKEFDPVSRNPFTWMACISWCLMGLLFGWIIAFPHHLEIDYGENIMSGMATIENIRGDVQKEFNEELYFLGLVRGCDGGCLQAASIEYGLTGKDHFEDFNNTPLYPPCVSYCLDAYGSKDEEQERQGLPMVNIQEKMDSLLIQEGR